MPSATYGGDFETTRIPPHTSGSAPTPSTDNYGLFRDPKPLPYSPPGCGGPVAAGPPCRRRYTGDDFADDRVKAAGRRGTQDFGLLCCCARYHGHLPHRTRPAGRVSAGGADRACPRWGLGSRPWASSTPACWTYLAAGTQISAGLLILLGLVHADRRRRRLAYVLDSLLANIAAQYDAGYVGFFLPDGNEYHILLIVVLSTIILPDRAATGSTRGVAGPGVRSSARSGHVAGLRRAARHGCCSTEPIRCPEFGSSACATRTGWALAVADLGQCRQRRERHGRQAHLIAGFQLRAGPRALVEQQALDLRPLEPAAAQQRPRRHGLRVGDGAQSHDQRREDHRDHQETAAGGQANIGTSSASVPHATAKCASAKSQHTAARPSTPGWSYKHHCTEVETDFLARREIWTADQCGGYRRGLCNRGLLVVIGRRVGV